MKFSETWLREWVNPPINTDQLTEQLTMAGLEVDSVTKVANDFEGVVVGHVLSAEQHPNADRLRVCEVDVGGAEVLTIVCGGANVRAHLKVPVAIPGAKLSPEFTIKTTKLRGVVSQGMICSAQELGLAETSEGILELEDDAPIGMDFRNYLHLNDHIIAVDLTPNRGDCLSVFGIAREVAAINALEAPVLPHWQISPTTQTTFLVQVLAPEDCPHYAGRVIQGISMDTPTPLWLKERLRRSGVRSIHLVVDITNYVLLELGQPLHAFDLDKLQGSIIVRRGNEGESLTLLDGRTIDLNAETLIIADEKGPLALAGIMGGLDSAITSATQNIFLESAFFSPLTISGRARSFGLSTDASHRFERFVCPDLQTVAIERATQLLIEIAGGVAGPLIVFRDDQFLPKPVTVLLRQANVERVLGVHFTEAEIEGLLQRLNMQLLKKSIAESWEVNVPLYRFDVQQEVDLIEEIARMYGYERIAPVTSAISANPARQKDHEMQAEIGQFLQGRGYHEAITYSFVDPRVQVLFNPDQTQLTLENPISSDLSVMRGSLWPGMLEAVVRNWSRRQLRVRLFEIGLRFNVVDKGHLPRGPVACGTLPCSQAPRGRGPASGATPRQMAIDSQKSNSPPAPITRGELGVGDELSIPVTLLTGIELGVGEVEQALVLAGVVTGTREPEQWGAAETPVDFFDVKGDLEGLFALAGRAEEFVFRAGRHLALHPGQTAEIFYQNQSIGYLGALHPELVQRFELEAPVYLFEVSLENFVKKESRYTTLSKFPAIRRDLAIVVDQAIPSMDLLNKIKSAGGEYLIDAWIFDVYQGEGILPSRKSVAVGLVWQHLERTLLDEEVAAKMQGVIEALEKEFNAVLRD